MILLAFLLFGLGAADFVGVRIAVLATICSVAIAIGVGVVMATIAGIDWWWAGSVTAAVVLWRLATAARIRSNLASLVAVSGLAAVAIAVVAAGSSIPEPSGALVDWYDELPYSAAAGVSFTTFALVVGGALFLIETSNVIVRLALRAEQSAPHTEGSHPSSDPPVAAETTLHPFGVLGWKRRLTTLQQDPADDVVKLKGGRFIGPIERLFLLVLVLVGQFGVMAAVVAAKGIIRFPEISKDTEGSKAEYFLVGSFTSWALVAAVALLIGLSGLGSS